MPVNDDFQSQDPNDFPIRLQAQHAVQTYGEFITLTGKLLRRVYPSWTFIHRHSTGPSTGTGTGNYPKIKHYQRDRRPVAREIKPRQRPITTDPQLDEKGRTWQINGQVFSHIIQFNCEDRTPEAAEEAKVRLEHFLYSYRGFLQMYGVKDLVYADEPDTFSGDDSVTWPIAYDVRLERLYAEPEYTISQIGVSVGVLTDLVENERVERSDPYNFTDVLAHDDLFYIFRVSEKRDEYKYLEGLHFKKISTGLTWLIPDPPSTYFVSYVYYHQASQQFVYPEQDIIGMKQLP